MVRPVIYDELAAKYNIDIPDPLEDADEWDPADEEVYTPVDPELFDETAPLAPHAPDPEMDD